MKQCMFYEEFEETQKDYKKNMVWHSSRWNIFVFQNEKFFMSDKF